MATQNEQRIVEIIVNGQKADASLRQMQSAAAVLNNQLRDLTPGTAAFIEKTKQLQEVNGRIQSVRNEIKGMDDSLKQAQTSSFSFKTAFTAAFAAISLKEVIQQVINFGMEAVKLAAEYSDSFADIRKSTGMTTQEVADLNEKLSQVDTRTSQKALLDIVKVGGQLGVAKEEVEGFTKSVDKAVVALGDEFAGGAEEVATQVGGLNKLFKDTKDLDAGESINKIGSAINELGAAGAANGPFLADFAKRIGGLGNLAPEISQTLGLGAALQELGESAENAAGGTKDILTAATKDIPAFAKQLGISADELKRFINNDPNEVILRMAQSFKGASNTKIMDTLQELNIKSSQGSGVMLKLATNVDFVKEKQELASKAMKEGTSLTNEFNIKNNTLAAQMEKNAKTVEKFKLSVGEGLAPAFSFCLEVIGQFFGFLKQGFSQLEPYFTAIGNAIADFAKSLGFAGDAGSIFSYIMEKIGVAVEFAFPILKVGITVISGLLYVFKMLYEYFPPFSFAINLVVGSFKFMYETIMFLVEGINKLVKEAEKFFGLAGKEVKVKASTEVTNKTTNTTSSKNMSSGGVAPVMPAEVQDTELTNSERDSLDKAAKEAEKKKRLEEKHQEETAKLRQDYANKSLAADQALESLRTSVQEKFGADRLAKLQAQHDKKLLQLELLKQNVLANEAITEDEKQALTQKYHEQELLLKQDFEQQKLELEEKLKEEEKEKKEAELEKKLEKITEEEEAKLAEEEQKFLMALETEAQKEAAFLDIKKAALQQKLDLLAAAGLSETAQAQKLKTDILAIEKEKTDKTKQLAADKKDFERAMTQARIDTAATLTDTIMGLLDKESGAYKVAKAVRKGIAVAEIAINLSQELSSIAKAAAANPLNAVTAGAAGVTQTAVQSGIAIARAVAGTIKVLGFNQGGFTGGGARAGGVGMLDSMLGLSVSSSGQLIDSQGLKVSGFVHENEWVGPKWMNEHPRYANVIGWLESSRQRGFVEGGFTTPGSAAPAPSVGDGSQVMLQYLAAILEENRALRSEVSTWQRTLQVHNNVGDTQSGIQMLNGLRNDASVG